jgi:hypothetical protein
LVYYVHSKVLCRFVHKCKICFCAVCAYVRGRVFSALADVRGIGFLDAKGCVNHVRMLKSVFGRHGKSPCFCLGGF